MSRDSQKGGLRLAPQLVLPLDAVTETFAILAKRRAGKSNAAVVMAEEMYDAGLPWVAIDPKGDWWGIRAAGDGKAPGLAVLVFGGEHADVPLEPTAGNLVADLVVDQRLTCVLDVSEMSKADQRRFLSAFAHRLYKRNREPLHVFCEEADEYIPQMVRGESAKVVEAFEQLVKRGGFRGIGITLITQRSASLNKGVLTQVETLIAMRTPSPQDRAAILDWVKVHDSGRDVVDELPGLADGEAWVFSPHWLNKLVKIRFRRRRTFDSGATPKVGGKPRPPATLADVEVESIRDAMAETIERAAADEPRTLRRRITELEQQLAAARNAASKPVEVPVPVEVPMLTQAQEKLLDKVTERVREQASDVTLRAEAAIVDIRDQVAILATMLDDVRAIAHRPEITSRPPRPTSVAPRHSASAPTSDHQKAPSLIPPAVQGNTPDSDVPPARQRLLDALVALESIGVVTAPRNQVALLAGVSPKSSGFQNNLGALRTAGLIDYPARGEVNLTDEGRSHTADAPGIATNDELHAKVRDVVSPARWRLLEPLLTAYPNPVSKDVLADDAGVSPKSSGYQNNLGALRSLGLLDYPAPGYVVASPTLFLEG